MTSFCVALSIEAFSVLTGTVKSDKLSSDSFAFILLWLVFFSCV